MLPGVVSWAMREEQLLVLHTVTNYIGTNPIVYDINDPILDYRYMYQGKYISPCY